jgi:hypothetical protein
MAVPQAMGAEVEMPMVEMEILEV